MAKITRYKPQPLLLSADSTVTREFHELKSQVAGLSDLTERDYVNYETHTIFNDIYLCADGRHICAVGPPLLNLHPLVSPIEVSVINAQGVHSGVLKHRLKNHDRVTFHQFALPAEFSGSQSLCISVKLANGQTMQVNSNRCQLDPVKLQFVTLQKNNPHQWILDWLRYHHALGVERVLFYDNGSDNVDELENQLGTAPDELEIVLIDWPFAYGPARSHYNQFCQASQNNHAYQYFGAAQWTGHFDVDEYLVFKQSDMRSLLASTGALTGQLRFDSYWMPNILSEAIELQPTARNYHLRDRKPRGKSRKYIARNDRVKMANTHKAVMKFPWLRKTVDPEEQVFFHYKPLTINWKTHANRHELDEYDDNRHIEDLDVIALLAKVSPTVAAADH